jgi:hypothetical protein
MKRWALAAVVVCGFAAAAWLARAADEAKGDKVDFDTYAKGYFEKNNSGLKGDSSYVVMTDQKGFDAVFGVGVTMGAKPPLLPKDAFDKKLVATVIKRGNAITEYTVDKVTSADGVLYVQYTAKAKGEGGTATFASPLIVAVDKGKITSVEFIENGKKVETVKVEGK